MTDVASQTVGEVVKRLMGYIIKHVAYVTSSAKHVRHMENRMKLLEDTSSDIKKHMNENKINNKEIPTHVPGWLQGVEKINEDVKSISSTTSMGCFNIKGRYQAATKALEATLTIERLIKENSETIWTDKQIPIGRSYSQLGSTSTPSQGDTKSGYKSRDRTFNVAMEHLQQDDKTHVIALCGMGGVGKTTMMKHLKTVAWDNKMFKYVVMVVVGGNFDLKSIQHALAVQTGDDITESDESLRAECLLKRFKKLAEAKQKCLVILDDVWNTIELADIGLNPLPNGFKLLLTSRDARICRQVAHDVEVVQVEVLEDTEARDLFFQITGVSELNDLDLYEIGGKIVKNCGGLPLAIKVIAATLKSQGKYVWEDTYHLLKKNKMGEEVQKCIEISYTNIKEAEEKEIFKLCGMFPEDSDIPIEDLTRYAWGLKFLEDVSTMEDARNRTKRCVHHLIDANLLMVGDSDHKDYVKVHDIVLAFVVDVVSNGEDACIIKHGDMLKWNEVKMSKNCKQISLACKGGFEFPQDFEFPNLSFLKLLEGDALMFPCNFYEKTKNLQVIAFDQLKYPLLPASFQCSSNLQTLCLHNCSLTFDISCMGELLNLEVLSFVDSQIKKLPSTFKNLKKLRVLDLRGCNHYLVIDDGVLKSLVTLEELYLIGDPKFSIDPNKAISFTDKIWKELGDQSKKLSALDIEIFENKPRLWNMSFENLRRFRISIGCFLDRHIRSYENTLKLVTNRGKILDSRLNELFKKTEVLLLTIDDMNNLADLEIISLGLSTQCSWFHNLRDLVIEKCGELGYLFTLNIATSLSKLESLNISSCAIVEEIIHIESREVAHAITFPKLKSLTLDDLPMLSCLCNTVNTIYLPELVDLKLIKLASFTSIYPKKLETSSLSSNISTMQTLLTEQVMIPKLERLSISDMKNLKEIWPYQSSSNEQVTLRVMKVENCSSLVNLFPYNPMSLLPHLEEIEVMTCSSVEAVFNVDMDLDCESVECNSRLRSIKVVELRQLREIWRVKGGNNSNVIISSFQAVETIEVWNCERFRNLFTPTTCKFDMRALANLNINCDTEREKLEEMQIKYFLRRREESETGKEQEINAISKEEIHEIHDDYFNAISKEEIHEIHGDYFSVSFPPNLIELILKNFNAVKMLFEINGRKPETAHQQVLYPYLKELYLMDMERMSHVWKCSSNWNWNDLFQKQQHFLVSSFHNLTTIIVSRCHNIKYLFSPFMAKLLSNLNKVDIDFCDGIEEVVSSRDDDDEEMPTFSSTHTISTLFPCFHSLSVRHLENLKLIGGGGAKYGSKLSQAGVVSWSLCQYTREIKIESCHALLLVIPSYAVGKMQKLEKLEIEGCNSMKEIFESEGTVSGGGRSSYVDEPLLENINVPQLSHLREIKISFCHLLEYVFTFSTLQSFRRLQELTIAQCRWMKEIVKEEINEEETMTSADGVVFPCVKYVELIHLRKIEISECRLLEYVFTFSTLQSFMRLQELTIAKCVAMKAIVKQDINKEQTTTSYDGVVFPCLKYVKLIHLRKIEISDCELLEYVFTFSTLESLGQLQELKIKKCKAMKEVVKLEVNAEHATSEVVVFPCLKTIQLIELPNLLGFFLGMNDFEWKSLENVVISKCPQIKAFTCGRSTAPNLKFIHSSLGKHHIPEHGLNFQISSASQGTPWSYQNLVEIHMKSDKDIKKIFSSNELLQVKRLERISVRYCDKVEEIFEVALDGTNNPLQIPNLTQVVLGYLGSLKYIWKINEGMVLQFPNLATLEIEWCGSLKHVFTSSMAGSLLQLQHLQISASYNLEVIFMKEEEEEEDGKVKAIELPRLKSLTLYYLHNLKGFCLDKDAFSFPSLDTLEIFCCPVLMVFTEGRSTAPKLKRTEIAGDMYDLKGDLNTFINTKLQEGIKWVRVDLN